jgi:hypothetical protein
MFLSVFSFGISSTACHITTCEHGSVCNDDDAREREDSCHALCDRLVVCGNVSSGDYDSCMSSCFIDFEHAPSSTVKACSCVARASCTEIAERRCPGAPVVGGGYTTSTGSSTVTAGATVTVGVTTGSSVTSGSTVAGGYGGAATTSGSGGATSSGAGGAGPGPDAGTDGSGGACGP